MRLLIAGCLWVIAASAMAGESEWQASTLTPATLKKVYQAAGVYQNCVGNALRAQINNKQDSRAVTDGILKQCEPQLQPMRDAFTSEKVPAEIADRYLQKTRTQTARNLLREVMATQAVRGAAPVK